MSVAILMGTYNGEKYLNDQMDSIIGQTYTNWHLYVSDDRSCDQTINIIKDYQSKYPGKISLRVQSERKGYPQNYFDLLLDIDMEESFYAFCDQDNIWHPDHLKRAVSALSEHSKGHSMYGAGFEYVDEYNKPLHDLKAWPVGKSLTFNNALLDTFARAYMMVFNNDSIKILRKASRDVDVSWHDWWAYIVISGVGGKVIFDPHVSGRHRIHGYNISHSCNGENGFIRVWKIFTNKARVLEYKKRVHERWTYHKQHIKALRKISPMLTGRNQETLGRFTGIMEASLPRRMIKIWKLGLYHHSIRGNLSFFMHLVIGAGKNDS